MDAIEGPGVGLLPYGFLRAAPAFLNGHIDVRFSAGGPAGQVILDGLPEEEGPIPVPGLDKTPGPNRCPDQLPIEGLSPGLEGLDD